MITLYMCYNCSFKMWVALATVHLLDASEDPLK